MMVFNAVSNNNKSDDMMGMIMIMKAMMMKVMMIMVMMLIISVKIMMMIVMIHVGHVQLFMYMKSAPERQEEGFSGQVVFICVFMVIPIRNTVLIQHKNTVEHAF